MKKILIQNICLLGCIIMLVSCSDFLTTYPADKYTQDNFWKNLEEVEAGLTGVYSVLRGYHSSMIFNGDNLSPNSVKFDDPGGYRSIARGDALTTNVLFQNAWESGYRGIGRANTVLANIEGLDISDNDKQRIIGEAKFLRAYFYFDLVDKFGDVPLITEQPNLEQSDQPRTAKEDIYNFIISDLTDASNLLPIENDPGRASKGAAFALKARVLLYNSEWELAAESAKAVMDLDKYSLFPIYSDLFKVANENNDEVIWDIQYKLPRFSHNFVNQATTHTHPAPLLGLVNAYLMIDGLKFSESPLYDNANPYKNRDPRLNQTVRLIGSLFNGKVTSPNDVPETFIGAKKWISYSDSSHTQEVSNGQSEINPIVIRYGEVLLTFAEAQNEFIGPDESVYNAINQIRSRQSVNMPSIPHGLSQDEMREVIRLERRIELAMEGYYYSDIRRWEIADEVMNGPVYNFYGDVYENRVYVAPKNNLWAIPTKEIDLNNNLSQNPGW